MKTFDDIHHRLTLSQPTLLSPDQRTHASVALILRETASDLEILFVERAARDGDPWSGDLGFPGGKVEKGDGSARLAAERETSEEIGLDLGDARYLGRLSDIVGVRLPIHVSCFVYGIEEAAPLCLSEEIRDTFWVSLADLVDPECRVTATFHLDGEWLKEPAIRLPQLDTPLLWGLTHRLVMQFLQILGLPEEAEGSHSES
jgi:8-oxo-dGTP pyrophosphatase MutT (NUDIX family)